MKEPRCSHCGSFNSVYEGPMRFQCSECGWWGPAADQILYPADDDVPFDPIGQVQPKPHDE